MAVPHFSSWLINYSLIVGQCPWSRTLPRCNTGLSVICDCEEIPMAGTINYEDFGDLPLEPFQPRHIVPSHSLRLRLSAARFSPRGLISLDGYTTILRKMLLVASPASDVQVCHQRKDTTLMVFDLILSPNLNPALNPSPSPMNTVISQ